MTGPYDDIIHLPHPISATRPQMPLANRAAQFSPFAALTGYDAAIEETARFTAERKTLDENAMAVLDMKLGILKDMISDRPEVAVTYFQKDKKKDGGAYVTVVGTAKKIDDYEGLLVLVNGEKRPLADILDINCELLAGLI
jgi:hypothetical protein